VSDTGPRAVRRRARIIAAAALALIAPPAVVVLADKKPDLARVYRGAGKPLRPVILIPGVFGSRLRDEGTGRIVWGRAASFITRLYRPWDAEWDLLDLPTDADDPLENRDNLRPHGIFDKVAGREYYARVLNTLRDVGGYTPGDIHNPRPEEDLFAFDYDWRRDAAETAARLARAIERILEARGDPHGKVDLLGHSLGGLLARYYVRYGGADVLGTDIPEPKFEGARRVHTVVHLGTPNSGTIDALRSLVEGTRLVRLLPPEAVFTMPAAYQLLPHPGAPLLLDGAGDPLPADLFDVDTWQRFGWAVFDPERLAAHDGDLVKRFGPVEGAKRFDADVQGWKRFASSALTRARRFIRALSVESASPDPVRYVAFGGDCTPTPARAVVIFDGTRHRTYFDPESIPKGVRTVRLEDLMLEPGDGSVTRASLLGRPAGGGAEGSSLPLASATFVCVSHRLLTENITFQDNLLHVLLERPL